MAGNIRRAVGMAAGTTAMNREREIYCIAGICIRGYGEDAVVRAAMRADELLAAGDLEGQRVWLQVIEAIKVLSGAEKPPRVRVH